MSQCVGSNVAGPKRAGGLPSCRRHRARDTGESLHANPFSSLFQIPILVSGSVDVPAVVLALAFVVAAMPIAFSGLPAVALMTVARHGE
jgi:hypothetical protein